MNLDHMMLRVDLGRTDDYGLFLNMHYAALQDLKADWREEDRDDFSLMMRCLQNDLHVLGLTAPRGAAATRAPSTAPSRLGAAYVIRGSRLGAAFLRKRVPAELIASYLDFSPALTWPNFLLQLDHASSAAGWDANDEVIRGAQATFGVFSARLIEVLAADR
jgi:heme oxygenase